MDALVFISAFLFGLDVGIGTAVVSWGVYGFINPYGQAGFPLILFLTAGECLYAIAGGVLRKTSFARDLVKSTYPLHSTNARYRLVKTYSQTSILFGVVGLFATFAYDILTNFATYLFLEGSLYQALIIGIITGAPFALVHEASNVIFFSTVAPGVILASKGLTRCGLR